MKELDVNAFELQKESSEYNKENDASKEVHFKLAGRCLLGLPKIQQTINNNNKKRRKTIEKKEGIDRGEGKERYASNSRKEFYPRIGSQQEQSREGERESEEKNG